MNHTRGIAALALLIAGWPGLAVAQYVEAGFSGVAFSDGGTVTGSFVYDTSTDNVVNWEFEIAGGMTDNFPPLAWNIRNSSVRIFDAGDLQPRITFTQVAEASNPRQLRITPSLPLSSLGDIPLQLDTGGGGSGGVECFNCNPFRRITNGSLVVQTRTLDFPINAGLNGGWFNPPTAGQGFFVDVLEPINSTFIGWFTYDTSSATIADTPVLGDAAHRWVTMMGPNFGSEVEADITLTEGGVFNRRENVANSNAGTARVTFFNCREGVVQFTLNGISSGSIPIARLADGNLDICQILAAP